MYISKCMLQVGGVGRLGKVLGFNISMAYDHFQTIVPPSASKCSAPLRLAPPNDGDTIKSTSLAVTTSLLPASLCQTRLRPRSQFPYSPGGLSLSWKISASVYSIQCWLSWVSKCFQLQELSSPLYFSTHSHNHTLKVSSMRGRYLCLFQ